MRVCIDLWWIHTMDSREWSQYGGEVWALLAIRSAERERIRRKRKRETAKPTSKPVDWYPMVLRIGDSASWQWTVDVIVHFTVWHRSSSSSKSNKLHTHTHTHTAPLNLDWQVIVARPVLSDGKLPNKMPLQSRSSRRRRFKLDIFRFFIWISQAVKHTGAIEFTFGEILIFGQVCRLSEKQS